QIVKEPISTKGPRLTCELSFPGRFLVLMPFQDKVSVSSKIKSAEERARLKQLIQSIKP
ncbi:MAG TPA: ribonuclease E/G, partial [Paraprevotella xylaniphila]|nr:ribonuclease E/G [Paraprevotella xylaniphila]